MYLSLLRLNTRSRRVKSETARPYELHRSLMKAFPDKTEGGPGRVLFRLDTNNETGSISILVQSEKEPDWEKLTSIPGYIQAYDYKEYNLKLSANQLLRFRLRANPTRRSQSNGKREGILKADDQLQWLNGKGKNGGFEILDASVINEGLKKNKKTDGDNRKHDVTTLSVRFDGLLRITDLSIFQHTLQEGIGTAKGFGFGLLSIAPVRG